MSCIKLLNHQTKDNKHMGSYLFSIILFFTSICFDSNNNNNNNKKIYTYSQEKEKITLDLGQVVGNPPLLYVHLGRIK
jgi:hypothetical protein